MNDQTISHLSRRILHSEESNPYLVSDSRPQRDDVNLQRGLQSSTSDLLSADPVDTYNAVHEELLNVEGQLVYLNAKMNQLAAKLSMTSYDTPDIGHIRRRTPRSDWGSILCLGTLGLFCI